MRRQVIGKPTLRVMTDAAAAMLSRYDDSVRKQARRMFDRFDRDESGTIQLEEMIQVVQEVDGSAAPEQVAALFQRADADGNGALDFDEFLAIITMPMAGGGLNLGALVEKLAERDRRKDEVGKAVVVSDQQTDASPCAVVRQDAVAECPQPWGRQNLV